MYSYRAYGLGIYSEFPLFDLPVQAVAQDVTIFRGRIESVTTYTGTKYPYLKLDLREAVFAVEGIGRYQVSDGCRIVVDPDIGAEETQVTSYLLGNALALLLYQRKRLMLHACVVSINQKAVAFLGDSGAGKSSIAAAFIVKGHNLLVDDLASVDMDAGIFWVDPGFPFIKLSSDALNLFPSNPEQLVYIDEIEDKALYRIENQINSLRVPLQHVFIIKRGEEVVLEPLNLQQALVELVRFSIPPSMVKLNHVAHFERLVEMVKGVLVHGLRRPESLSHLPRLVSSVEEIIT